MAWYAQQEQISQRNPTRDSHRDRTTWSQATQVDDHAGFLTGDAPGGEGVAGGALGFGSRGSFGAGDRPRSRSAAGGGVHVDLRGDEPSAEDDKQQDHD